MLMEDINFNWKPGKEPVDLMPRVEFRVKRLRVTCAGYISRIGVHSGETSSPVKNHVIRFCVTFLSA